MEFGAIEKIAKIPRNNWSSSPSSQYANQEPLECEILTI